MKRHVFICKEELLLSSVNMRRFSDSNICSILVYYFFSFIFFSSRYEIVAPYIALSFLKGYFHKYLRVRTEGPKPLEINKLFQRRRVRPCTGIEPSDPLANEAKHFTTRPQVLKL